MISNLIPRHIALLPAALVGAIACSSSANSGDSGNIACTIKLTGAQTGSSDCSNVLAIFATDSNLSDVSFSNPAGSPVVNVNIRLPGELTTKTYQSTDAGVIASVLVDLNNTSLWAAVTDPSSQTPFIGSFTLTISSVSVVSSSESGKVFRAHGSLTATLPSESSTAATGTVTVNATF